MDKFLAWVDQVGGQANVARLLGVTRGAVNHWTRGRTQITPDMARKIERVSRGKVKAVELVFGKAA